MTRWQQALERIQFSRDYTLRLIDHIPDEQWFQMPGGVSHVAWQVGHLAMAQYRLALERIRNTQPEDPLTIPEQFLVLFAKGSTPAADPALYPSPAEIRRVLAAVHALMRNEIPNIPEADWDLPPWKAHPLFQTRIDSLFWCAHHEMLHAGQIGLLRRLQGETALW